MTSLSSHKPKVRLENLAIAFVVLLRVFAVPLVSAAKPKLTGQVTSKETKAYCRNNNTGWTLTKQSFAAFFPRRNPFNERDLKLPSGNAQEIFTSSVEKYVEIDF
jgi:hypothetical protein